jgi:POT family proton-dependent oligopeptide transporter
MSDRTESEREREFFLRNANGGVAAVPEGQPLVNMTTAENGSIFTPIPPEGPPPAAEKMNFGMSPSTSRTTSSSPTSFDDELPSNVHTEEQLKLLPEECLSGNTVRPLRHVDEDEDVYHYALEPMFYSVILILVVELLERFAFYGINYTQTSYLTGAYDDNWNAGMDAIPASSYVSVSVAVAYTTPFLGAFLADSLLGEYWSIIFGSIFFYIPGLFLIAFTTVPGFLGPEFNHTALAMGLLFLWPVGTGIVKSCVNVFGAKQFHPLLQSSLIEAYYVKFYMCINVGALVGGIAVPILAQTNVTVAYFLPVAMLSCGVCLFLLGSRRYVISKPKAGPFAKKRKRIVILNSNTNIDLSVIYKISLLIVPFCIAYSQMATTFILQGTVMEKGFGFIDAASMNNADAVAVLLFGSYIGTSFYPMLARRGIKIPTTYKFAIGSGLGALSIGWALLVEYLIHHKHNTTGGKVSILWQTWSYVFIGAGEIFAVSAAYEVAFTASPPEKKVLASAINLFCIGGLPNVLCIALYHVCQPWFENSRGTTSISHLEDYASAHIDRYFWVLFAIAILGVVVNLLPSVRQFVERVEEAATDMIKTPKTPSRPPKRDTLPDEESPMIRAKRHQEYLKYGSGPTLFKHGSFRAGASMSQRGEKTKKHIKKSMISKLYRSDPVMPGVGTVISAQGRRVVAAPGGALLIAPKGTLAPSTSQPELTRSSSD